MMVREGRAQPRQSAQKPKSYQSYSYPAPTLGLMALNNLSVSVPGSAQVLENYWPTANGAIMRRGKQIYATLGSGALPVTSIFSYVVGGQRELYASTSEAVYNITSVTSPVNMLLGTENDDILGTENDDMIGVQSTDGLDVLSGQTGGDWVVVQYATAGGTFLVGVNGSDPAFIYDGTMFYPNHPGGIWELPITNETAPFTAGETITGGTSGATATILSVDPDHLWIVDITGTFDASEAITDGDGGAADTDGAAVMVSPGVGISFPPGVNLTTADLSYVWNFKNRLWFIQKDSLTAWYLDVDQIGGELTAFPLGGVLGRGGHLVFGATWSQDVGNGLNALCAFVSSEGEAAVYQGSNPSSATDWGIVGVYQTGKPMGAKAHVQVGGDIVMASDVAFVPLSEALRREYSQIGANSLSAPIEALWPEEVVARTASPWHCAVWTARQAIIVGLPTTAGEPPKMMVVNSRTGKWATFSNWGSTCLHVFNDRLFIGDTLGRVFEADVTGLDDGVPYTATYLPSFDQMDVPGRKVVSTVQVVLRSPHKVALQVSVHTDFDVTFPPAPPAAQVSAPGTWGDPGTIWGQFTWGSTSERRIQQSWKSQFGAGEVISVGSQITSGSVVPLDVEIVRTDAVFTVESVMS